MLGKEWNTQRYNEIQLEIATLLRKIDKASRSTNQKTDIELITSQVMESDRGHRDAAYQRKLRKRKLKKQGRGR